MRKQRSFVPINNFIFGTNSLRFETFETHQKFASVFLFVHGLKISWKSKTGGCFKARLTRQRANFFCVSKNGVSNQGRDRFQLGMNDVWTGSWYSILLPLVYLVSTHLKENQCIRPQAYSCTSMAKFFTLNCIFFIFRKK